MHVVNTLNAPARGKSLFIEQHRQYDQKPALPNSKSKTINQSILSYSNEAEGSPPRKRQKTTSKSETQSNTIIVQDDDDIDPLHSDGVLEGSDHAKTSVRSSVKDTPMRRLSEAGSRTHESKMSTNTGPTFTRNATIQRKQQEAQQSPRTIQYTRVTPNRKPSIRSGPSKMAGRLNGSTAKSESPDVLHPDAPTISSPISEPDYPRFDLELFFCKGLDADDSNCYVLVRPKSLEIGCKNELLSKDALFALDYSKIRSCRMADSEKDPAGVLLSLSGGTIPSNVCYLVFKSQKTCFDFVNLIRGYHPHLKVLMAKPGWMGDALGAARARIDEMSSADRAEWERRKRADLPASCEHEDSRIEALTQPRKRIGRLQPFDKPPDQEQPPLKPAEIDRLNQENRTTRSRYRVTNENMDESAMKPRPNNDERGTQRTRSRSMQQVYIDEKPPPKAEPRVIGTPWTKPLTYPSMGARKQTIEWADLKRLEDEELLNDNIVGLFLRYLQENADPTHSRQIHTMSTFFYETLMRPTDRKTNRKQINYAAVSKWTKSVDIFDRDFVIVPINESLHWYTLLICNLRALTLEKQDLIEFDSDRDDDNDDEVVLVEEQPSVPGHFPQDASKEILKSDLDVDKQSEDDSRDSGYEKSQAAKRGPKKKPLRAQRKYNVHQPIIITLDSLDTGGRSSTASMLKDYVIEEGKQKRNLEVDKLDIKGMTAKGIPHQGNFYDCGLYVCLYLEKFMSNPHKFAQAVLTREDSALNWPKRLSSSNMRQRFYEFLQELYNAQEEGRKPEVPNIGQILIRDEDYLQPESKAIPPKKRSSEPDRERMENGLRHAAKYYDLSGPTESHEHPQVEPAGQEHTMYEPQYRLNSLEEYVAHANEPVVIEDNTQSPTADRPVESPYFAGPNLPTSICERTQFGSPQELAEDLCKRRKSITKKIESENIIDLSSPSKQPDVSQELEPDRDMRGISVSTDYLSSSRSYEAESGEVVRPQLMIQRSVIIGPKESQQPAPVGKSSQNNRVNDTSSVDSPTFREGVQMGEELHRITRDGRGRRDISVVPESECGARSDSIDKDDVQIVESSPTVVDDDEVMLLD